MYPTLGIARLRERLSSDDNRLPRVGPGTSLLED